MAATVPASMDLIDAATALAPVIASYRDESERERSLPRALVTALAEADLLRMYAPKSQGGLEADPVTCLRVLEELAKADGAVAWNVMNWGAGHLCGARLAEPAVREIYARDPSVVISGALAPKGRAEVVEGGYRLSGRWPLASGCAHASWLVAGCVIIAGGQPRFRPDGAPDVRLVFVPQAECEIVDTWQSAGLRGTGSHDFSVQEAFVPEERTFAFPDGPAHEPGPLYRGSILDELIALLAAVALGIARAALDSFTELASRKVPTRTATLLRDRATVQAQLAQAEALVRSARVFMFETTAAAWETLCAGESLSDEQHALQWLAAVHAATSCAHAVDLVFTLGGATSVYTTSRLERCFRDVHVLTQHVGVSPWQWERVGRYFLGLGIADVVGGGAPGALSGG
ncbi:MAG TPA: acyl-CoA dehydrogenase family protein [Chloroflexota bacterium]|nr:acyl-CoA dehydrogenase family protein [Chloroflexota bacterium]